MNIGHLIAQIFSKSVATSARAASDAARADAGVGSTPHTPGAGKTQLDRLMASADRLDRIAPPQMHQVRAGETLTIIASAYGTSWQNLARINGLGNVDMVQVGTMLRLPAGDIQGSANAVATVGTNALPVASGVAVNMVAALDPMTQIGTVVSLSGAAIIPASAQLAAAPPPPALHSDPEAHNPEDFSLWCKVATCPNLDPDVTRQTWPCTACGRSGSAEIPALQ
jgi:LysM repeat protein